MIYVAGDTHGDITRFSKFKKMFRKQKDFLLICGDFGFIWDGSEKEADTIKKLEKLDCIIMFVEGCHDNIDLLSSYPLEQYCEGTVRRIAKNVYWMQRGEIFYLYGTSVFALGGGESHDADERIQGVTWWPDELPSSSELEHAAKNLESVGNKVDIIITHQNPLFELGLIGKRPERVNALTNFLEKTLNETSFSRWYFGSEHVDKAISGKMTSVFEKIVAYEK